MADKKIKILKDGPYLVSGNIPMDKEYIIPDPQGIPIKWEKGDKFPQKAGCSLCRCGKTKTPPFCDGEHISSKFIGTETAKLSDPHSKADITTGPALILSDAEELCAAAFFCHRAGNTWTLTEKSDDPTNRKIAIQESFDCPAGRLKAIDKGTEKPIEPQFLPSISVTEDLSQKVSGPLWIKGDIVIESADGKQYFQMNRRTLCRCGKSKNKPFCDGGHCAIKFNDGDGRIK